MDGFILSYNKKCECDLQEWYWMGLDGKCQKRGLALSSIRYL